MKPFCAICRDAYTPDTHVYTAQSDTCTHTFCKKCIILLVKNKPNGCSAPMGTVGCPFYCKDAWYGLTPRAGMLRVQFVFVPKPTLEPAIAREHLRLMRAHEDILNEINRLSIERGLLRAHISNQVESASSREKLLVSELRQRASNRAALEDATEELNKELGKVVQLEETLYKKHASKPLLLPKTIQFTIGSVKPARNSPKRQPIDDGSSDDEDVVDVTPSASRKRRRINAPIVRN
ncbi:hypothetical protein NLI96_g7393 [Meripilus lineatus]|uniref:RING-type domain-containing protein n=1 Tax=Meripilus lineatus TaxID=2056292 RepID=A0AAD5UZH3_9APHY|nr:hypothetical protein NLI96_g7393 [Physisporinus lineatus]